MFIYRRTITAWLCILTLFFSVSSVNADGNEAANPFVNPNNPNLVYDQHKTVARFPVPEGSIFRSAYTFSDGSVGVFATNTVAHPAPQAPNDKDALREKLWAIPPKDTLLRFDGDGKFLEKFEIPITVEHPYNSRGPISIIRNNVDQYWAILQGTLVDTIAGPRETMVVNLLSHEIVRFDKSGSILKVDIRPYLPSVLNTAIVVDLKFNGDILFVSVVDREKSQAYILAFDSVEGTFLYRTEYSGGFRGQLIPLKAGKLGMYLSESSEVLAFSSPLPKILNVDQAEQRVSLKKWPIHLSSIGSISKMASGEFAYINAGLTSILDEDLKTVRTQAMEYLIGTTPCIGCSRYSSSYLLSSTRQLILTESELLVQELHPISAILDGKQLLTDSPIYYDKSDGRVWVPLRAAAEAMGAIVSYDATKRILTIELEGRTVLIHQDKPEIAMKTLINYSKTYVGVRALSELLGIDVNWNQATYTVELGASKKQ